MTALANPAAENPRAANGPIAVGNPAARMAQLRMALLNTVTPEDIEKIAKAMIAKAAEGSLGAAKLVFSYVLGKPEPAPESNRAGAAELLGGSALTALADVKLTPEQEKSIEAVYQALYGESPPSPNGNKRERKDATPSAVGQSVKK